MAIYSKKNSFKKNLSFNAALFAWRVTYIEVKYLELKGAPVQRGGNQGWCGVT